VADALLALGPDALAAAHALYEELAPARPAPDALLAEAERVARLGAFAAALAAGASLDALRAAAGAADARECARLTRLALDAVPAAAVGDAVVAMLSERSAESYAAGARLVAELLRAESEAGADDAARALDALLAGVDRVRWAGDAEARRARAALAVAAARRGDGERFVQLAEADAPWAELAAGVRPNASRPAATVVAALAHACGGDADAAVAALDAIGALAATLAGAARRDAAALAFAVASRAVAAGAREVADDATPDRLRRLTESLLGFWIRVAPADARGEAVRRLLDASSLDAAAVAQLAALPADERAGWLGAATLRALAHDADVAAVVRVSDAAGTDASLGTTLGALLVRAAAHGPPLGGRWPALLAHVDEGARRTLLARALARSAGDPARLDALAATCGALAELDYRLDAAAAEGLVPPLARWAATLPPTRAGAARLGAALALLGELADADAAAALVAAALRDAPDGLRSLVQLRRLAAAAVEVEATREPAAWAARRAALRALRAGDALLPAQREALRGFLGVSDERGGLLGALLPRREGGR
jgi:hypothetical protein